ncbi:related to RNA-binding protein rnp24 [Melanopsichium pennsylvanicum]|uniref:Related to RNA-binding protein rnp24 n=1 Tax=Melanopsichium pennsylvanicum TaxID=63383 RepID=A0AAJ5C8S1_9BASI|nr:related to RNA-binding protein rnp24 [Melanopsichium pennsylvanicum]
MLDTDKDTEVVSASVAATVGDGADRPLTNKEKRQLAVAQKRAAKEQAAARKVTAPLIGEKRKAQDLIDSNSDAADTSTVTANGEADQGQVEVLSHKEMRKRKKLGKLNPDSIDATAATADADPNNLIHPSRAAIATPSLQPRSGFSIWVGNLSFFTAPAKLVDWFNQRGVDGISRVNMPKGMRRAEMNRGFCYLDLPSKDMLTAALNLSEQPLDGRKLLIKNGSDFTGRPDINSSALGIARTLPSATNSMYVKKEEDDQEDEEEKEEEDGKDGEKTNENGQDKGEERKGKTGLTKTAQKILRAQKNPPSMTLFLGNLSFNTTDQGVRDLFDHSATVRNPKLKKTEIKLKKEDIKDRDATKRVNKSKHEDDDDDDDDDEGESDSDSSCSSSTTSESEKDKLKKDLEKTDNKNDATSTISGQGQVVGSSAGIRKVRLGTFQDAPTKCKGFGFIDFHTVEQATSSLIDVRNQLLDGRKIVLQYASVDATRRGASVKQKGIFETKRCNPLKVGFQRNKPVSKHFDIRDNKEEEVEVEVVGRMDVDGILPKKHKETKQERLDRRARQGGMVRQKPGAVLANAKRASLAVVKSTGTKISFDDE